MLLPYLRNGGRHPIKFWSGNFNNFRQPCRFSKFGGKKLSHLLPMNGILGSRLEGNHGNSLNHPPWDLRFDVSRDGGSTTGQNHQSQGKNRCFAQCQSSSFEIKREKEVYKPDS